MFRMIIPVLALAACTHVETAPGPDGRTAHLITCDITRQNHCMQKAAELCPGGYEILGQNSWISGYVYGYPITNLRLTTRCKA